MKNLLTTLLLLISCLTLSAQTTQHSLKIDGKTDFSNDGDSVILNVYNYGIVSSHESLQTTLISTIKKGSFHFAVKDGQSPRYISINFKGNHQNLNEYLVEPGTSLSISYLNNQFTVTGQKSEGFKLQYQMKQIESNFYLTHKVPHFNAINLERVFANYDSIAGRQLELLELNRNKISTQLHKLLLVDYAYSADLYKYESTYYWLSQDPDSSSNPVIKPFKNYAHNFKTLKSAGTDLMSYSYNYKSYLIEKFKVENTIIRNSKLPNADVLSFVSSNFQGSLRESLIIQLFVKSKDYSTDFTRKLKQIYPSIHNNTYRNIISDALTVAAGEKAFDFSLRDTAGRLVRLSDLRGQVVVLDFWYTGCPGCKEIAPYLAKTEENFNESGVKFIGVNIDANKAKWLKSVRSGTYVAPNIMNLNTGGRNSEVLKRYKVKFYPTIILINKQGKIIIPDADPRGDDGLKLNALISKLLKE